MWTILDIRKSFSHVLFLLSVVWHHSVGVYIEGTNDVPFSTAESQCKSLGLSLPVAPSYYQYTRFEEMLVANGNAIPNEFWMGLHKPKGATDYQWLTNQTLSLYWMGGEPGSPEKKHCVLAARDNEHYWKTTECVSPFFYICVNYSLSETDYNLHKTAVDYHTARRNCKDIGQDLAMVKNKQQYDALSVFLDTETPSQDVWIGLEGFAGDKGGFRKFRWIDGDFMNTIDWASPDLVAESSDMCVIYKDNKWQTSSCEANNFYICTEPFTGQDQVPLKLTNMYYLVENKQPYIQPLHQATYKRKLQCAVQCSRTKRCYMYIYDGNNCEIFKRSNILVHNDRPGRKLYVRKTVS